MKCLNLTDIDTNISPNRFERLIRVDHLYIGSMIHTSEQIKHIQSLSIKTVIDLRSPNEKEFNDEEKFIKHGLKYESFPILDFKELDFKKLQDFSKLININEKTLIYCTSGNRASAILALNCCFICGHPKKRVMDFAEKIGLNELKTKNIIINHLDRGQLL